MSKQLIAAGDLNPFTDKHEANRVLQISEFFYDTIQGEGIYTGHPAMFLRLTNCTLNCVFCDSEEVWRTGDFWEFNHILDMMEEKELHTKLSEGQHLVLTGGSPLMQQVNLATFLTEFNERFKFRPFIEVENECVLPIMDDFEEHIDCWNNSPKLMSSGNSHAAIYKPKLVRKVAQLDNSWFKFVISSEKDWDDLYAKYILTDCIEFSQVILMPEGQTREELDKSAPIVVDLAIRYGVRFSTREHIILWDKKVGV